MKPSRVQRVGTRLRDCSEIAEANLFRYGRSERNVRFLKGREKKHDRSEKKTCSPNTYASRQLFNIACRSSRVVCEIDVRVSLGPPKSRPPSPRSHPAPGATLGPRPVPSVFVCDTRVRPSSSHTTAAICHLTRRAPICLLSRAGNVYTPKCVRCFPTFTSPRGSRRFFSTALQQDDTRFSPMTTS